MACRFDRFIDRTATESVKWHTFEADVLPMGIADMDFQAPEPVIRALRERVEHGIFGYAKEPPELRQVFVERLKRLYDWSVSPEALVFMAGVVPGLNVACQAITRPGDGILAQTPVYGPILAAPAKARCKLQTMALEQQSDGRYTVDLDRMEHTIDDRTRLFLLCNPHNPVGRVFTRQELSGMAEICLRHDMYVCSDAIHCELLFSGHKHIPIGSLWPEIGERTITLMSPSKTYNIAGFHCAVAIIPNAELRQRFQSARQGMLSSVGLMGLIAAQAAYRDSQSWLGELLVYLEQNRDLTYRFVNERLPGIGMGLPEAMFLAWLDCRQAEIKDNAQQFFLERARVGLSDGTFFGPDGAGFVRLNFGCCRDTLTRALQRMENALS